MPFNEETPMQRKTPYKTGIGINCRRKSTSYLQNQRDIPLESILVKYMNCFYIVFYLREKIVQTEALFIERINTAVNRKKKKKSWEVVKVLCSSHRSNIKVCHRDLKKKKTSKNGQSRLNIFQVGTNISINAKDVGLGSYLIGSVLRLPAS